MAAVAKTPIQRCSLLRARIRSGQTRCFSSSFSSSSNNNNNSNRSVGASEHESESEKKDSSQEGHQGGSRDSLKRSKPKPKPSVQEKLKQNMSRQEKERVQSDVSKLEVKNQDPQNTSLDQQRAPQTPAFSNTRAKGLLHMVGFGFAVAMASIVVSVLFRLAFGQAMEHVIDDAEHKEEEEEERSDDEETKQMENEEDK